MTIDDLLHALRSGRFDLATEKGAQADIEAHLTAAIGADAFIREAKLDHRDRPDFLVDRRFVIEVKLRGAQKRAIFDQLSRYARHPQVEALILATNLSMGLPEAIGGKPAYYLSLGRAWL